MLNYKQLYYFWNVAKAGSIVRGVIVESGV